MRGTFKRFHSLSRSSLILLVVLIVFLTISAPFRARAQTEAEAVLNFARSLFEKGDYFRAAGEAERFLFLYPDHIRKNEARTLLDRAGKSLGEAPKEKAAQALDPWIADPEPDGPPNALPIPKPNSNRMLFVRLVRFYQDHLRTFRNPALTCPSYPCNSDYAISAMKKHGPYRGAAMTVDRLWREATHAGQPPYVLGSRGYLHYDPLEHNDYWLNPDPEEP